MRIRFLIAMRTMMVLGVVILSTGFKEKNKTSNLKVAATEDCSEWQKIDGVYIQMKWCTSDTGEVTHQFYNVYNVDIHFWYKFECKDGRTYTGNIYLNSGQQSDRADMMKSKPNMWYITKKEKKGADGRWEAF